MTAFWIVATLLIAAGLVFILPPIWGTGRRERVLAGGAALAFPLLVAGVYFAAGTPGAIEPRAVAMAGAAGHAASQEQLLAMVAGLAERMRATPEDADGWIMLARSYSALGRYADALHAFERAVQRKTDDARLFADYADVAAMAQGRRLAGKPETLIQRALAIEPQNLKALSLSGTAAFEKGDYVTAAEQWRKLLALAPPGSPLERSVRGSIAEAEQKSGQPRKSGTPADSVAVAAKPAMSARAARKSVTPANSAAAIEGRIELSAALKERVKPGDTVFIFARVPGERVPLAMLRKHAAELPAAFRLDDSVSMNPAAKLSDAKEIVVVARVSRSGQTVPQPGDLQGASATVRPGAKGIVIRIDSEAQAPR